jgi:mono/diheme cytochrome c family protein
MVMKLARILGWLVVGLFGLYLVAALLYTIPLIGGLRDDTMAVTFDRVDPSVIADYANGLTTEERRSFYHMSQGAEILPWALLTAVDAPDSDRPFVENLARFGLMPDPERDDGLPIGMSLARNDFTFGMEFAGITCAACHVGELRHDGRAIRVDGAPNMFNMQHFYAQAVEAFAAVISDPDKRWRALKRLGRQDYDRYGLAAPFVRPATLAYYGMNMLMHRDRLDNRLELVAVIDAAREHRDPAHPTSGFGRLDAFDGTRNFLFTRLRDQDPAEGFAINAANMVALDAAVKFPPLWSRKASAADLAANPGAAPPVWGFRDYDWVEWTLNTNTVMERNITETLGAGATVILDPARGSLFESSIPARNMHALEELAYGIDPPLWPAEVFGAIQPDLVARGAPIFQSRCAGCHEYDARQRTETGLITLRGLGAEIVGTDPTFALRISCPVPDIGPLELPRTDFSAAQATLLKDCAGVTTGVAFKGYSFARTVQAAVDGIKAKAYAAAAVDADEQALMEDFARRGPVAWRDTLLTSPAPRGPYAARPLYGIWAAAPYLHNGSVPTLHDLLLLPAERPVTFALGARDYDPVKLGFVARTSCAEQDCLVDTRRVGDGNGGHTWGTDLPEADRMALLEFLKTY